MATVKRVKLIGGKIDPAHMWKKIPKEAIKNGYTWRAVEASVYSRYPQIVYAATYAEAIEYANQMNEELWECRPWEDMTWD